MKNIKILIFLFAIINAIPLFAQKQGIHINGTVLESSSQKAIEFATVSIQDKTTQQAITGVTTDSNGNFKIQVDKKDITVKISFIGFTPKIIESFSIDNGNCLLYTSPSPRDQRGSRMPSSA